MLGPHELGWTRQRDLLFLTTKEHSQHEHAVHVYRPAKGVDAHALCAKIKKQYRPNAWRTSTDGREGDILLYGNAIVLSHNEADHFSIAQQFRDELTPCTGDGSSLLPEALLRRRDFEFHEAQLSDAVEWLRKETRLRVDLDEKALADAAIGTDTLITLRLKNASLEAVLDRLAHDHALGWYYARGGLYLTTDEQLDTNPHLLVPCVFDTRGLLVENSFAEFEDLLIASTPGNVFPEMSGPTDLYRFIEPHHVLCKVPYHCQRDLARLTEALRAALRK
jgi:hypothetical protein